MSARASDVAEDTVADLQNSTKTKLGPITVSREPVFVYSLEEVPGNRCESCGHVHNEPHSCNPTCAETERESRRSWLSGSGSYRAPKRTRVSVIAPDSSEHIVADPQWSTNTELAPDVKFYHSKGGWFCETAERKLGPFGYAEIQDIHFDSNVAKQLGVETRDVYLARLWYDERVGKQRECVRIWRWGSKS